MALLNILFKKLI